MVAGRPPDRVRRKPRAPLQVERWRQPVRHELRPQQPPPHTARMACRGGFSSLVATTGFSRVPASLARAWLLRNDEQSAPGLRGDIVERFRERPLVAGEVFGLVLALAVLEVDRLHDDARPVGPGTLAMFVHVGTRTITLCVTSPGRGGRLLWRTPPTMTAPSPTLSCERWFSPIRTRSTKPNAELSQATASRTSG